MPAGSGTTYGGLGAVRFMAPPAAGFELPHPCSAASGAAATTTDALDFVEVGLADGFTEGEGSVGEGGGVVGSVVGVGDGSVGVGDGSVGDGVGVASQLGSHVCAFAAEGAMNWKAPSRARASSTDDSFLMRTTGPSPSRWAAAEIAP
jgi:hypothetical protein